MEFMKFTNKCKWESKDMQIESIYVKIKNINTFLLMAKRQEREHFNVKNIKKKSKYILFPANSARDK